MGFRLFNMGVIFKNLTEWGLRTLFMFLIVFPPIGTYNIDEKPLSGLLVRAVAFLLAFTANTASLIVYTLLAIAASFLLMGEQFNTLIN